MSEHMNQKQTQGVVQTPFYNGCEVHGLTIFHKCDEHIHVLLLFQSDALLEGGVFQAAKASAAGCL